MFACVFPPCAVASHTILVAQRDVPFNVFAGSVWVEDGKMCMCTLASSFVADARKRYVHIYTYYVAVRSFCDGVDDDAVEGEGGRFVGGKRSVVNERELCEWVDGCVQNI